MGVLFFNRASNACLVRDRLASGSEGGFHLPLEYRLRGRSQSPRLPGRSRFPPSSAGCAPLRRCVAESDPAKPRFRPCLPAREKDIEAIVPGASAAAFERWIRSKPSASTARTPSSETPFAAQSRDDPMPYRSPAIITNRGHDSIAIFAVGAADGRLTSIGWQPSNGKTPRFFAIDPTGRRLFAANDETDSIVTFELDPANGKLTQTDGSVRAGSPVCIVFKIASK
jgi:Lactonase, 7-bladed beta-propeller